MVYINASNNSIRISKELDFQRLGNVTYEKEHEHIYGLINQLRSLIINKETYEKEHEHIYGLINQLNGLNIKSDEENFFNYILELIHQFLQRMSKGFPSRATQMYQNNIMTISEYNAAEYLKSHSDITEPVLMYVNEIKDYLRDLGKNDEVFIMLQRSPEYNDFKVLILNIKTEFTDLDEKLDLYDDIGDILNDITDRIASNKGEEIYDKLSMVTYLLEENNV